MFLAVLLSLSAVLAVAALSRRNPSAHARPPAPLPPAYPSLGPDPTCALHSAMNRAIIQVCPGN